MKIGVMGTGYVGLVTSACLAEKGHFVTAVDIDRAKIAALEKGELPIFEPGLAELIKTNLEAGRLTFERQLPKFLELIFVTVGTPLADSGKLDMSQVEAAVEEAAAKLGAGKVIAIKSTILPGTISRLSGKLREQGRQVELASVPEFLKEGHALEDFRRPDRVVIGTHSPKAIQVLTDLFQPFLRTNKPLYVVSPESAALGKLGCNAMLANRISFMNQLAMLCGELVANGDETVADIEEVREIMGSDRRIGPDYLFAGLGFGGSCFPKDVQALSQMTESDFLFKNILEINQWQSQNWAFCLLDNHFGEPAKYRQLTYAVWGLAFKPNTDDIREAPALALVDGLLRRQVKQIRVHDPVALKKVWYHYGDQLTYCPSAMEAASGADVLLIATEWPEFREPDWAHLEQVMNSDPVIIDGRNLYCLQEMAERKFHYYSVGRRAIRPRA